MQTKTSSKGIIWGITQKSLFNIYFSFPAALSANGGHRSGPAGRRRSCCVVGEGGEVVGRALGSLADGTTKALK